MVEAASRRPRISAAPAAQMTAAALVAEPGQPLDPVFPVEPEPRADRIVVEQKYRPDLRATHPPIQQHERIAALRQTMLDQAVGSQLDQLRPFRRAQKSRASHAPSKNPSRRNWQALFRLPSESGYTPIMHSGTKVLVFASQKGGSGKTTISGHIAIQAERSGLGLVAVIDTDPQRSLAQWRYAREDTGLLLKVSDVDNIANDIEELKGLGIRTIIVDTPPAATSAIGEVVCHADLVVIPTRPSPHDLRAVGCHHRHRGIAPPADNLRAEQRRRPGQDHRRGGDGPLAARHGRAGDHSQPGRFRCLDDRWAHGDGSVRRLEVGAGGQRALGLHRQPDRTHGRVGNEHARTGGRSRRRPTVGGRTRRRARAGPRHGGRDTRARSCSGARAGTRTRTGYVPPAPAPRIFQPQRPAVTETPADELASA